MASSAADYVRSGFNQSADYAADAWNLIQQYVDEVMQNYSRYTSISIPKDFVFDPDLAYTPNNSVMPAAPTFPAVPTIEDNFTMPDLPSKPEVTLPSKPTLKDHIIPEFSSDITIPQFSETLPVIDLTPVEEEGVMSLFGYMASDYAPYITEVKDILLDRIRNGGTGLPADIETAIWNRNLERDEQTLQDSIDALATQWAKMNFSLPDGLLSHAITDVNAKYNDKRQDASREISIKQAELENTNINEALKLVASIDGAFNGAMAQYVNASANAMKVSADVAVQLYNTSVQYYNLLLDSYKAKASVYTALVNARATDAEIYKAQVDGVGQAIAADESKIRVYTAEIGAEESKLNAYKTELEGVATQIEATKSWLDMGRTRMELYATETRALSSKFVSQIEGFKTEVLAWSAESDTKVKDKDISLRAQTSTIEANIREVEIFFNELQEKAKIEVQKMATLAEVGSHVVAGALAAAHASASLSESENTQITG